MNHYLLSILLGIVEGVTEFLPVSSTAHLRIVERAMGLDLASGYWKMYSIVIQLGAILCLPIYFRARLWEFFKTFPHGPDRQHNLWNHPVTLTGVAFVVHRRPRLPADQGDRQEPGEPVRDVALAHCGRGCHVGGGRGLWRAPGTGQRP